MLPRLQNKKNHQKVIQQYRPKVVSKTNPRSENGPRHIIHDERSEIADSGAPIRFVMPEEKIQVSRIDRLIEPNRSFHHN